MAERHSASWFVYVVRLSDRFSQAERDAVLQGLRDEGIGCNRYFVPIHAQPFVQEATGSKPGDFPQAERTAARTLALPFHAKLTASDIDEVCGVLERLLQILE
jgi:perosamine synthetase